MRAIWNGFISFGLVTIPVSVGLAQQRSDVSFRTLSRANMQPVKQKRWDPDRDVEVGPDDTVKGWEVSKGQYVAVEEAELERFAARQEKTIRILQFVDVSEVDPVYFERAYWLDPQERAERPYLLLTRAMEESGRAALGRFVLSTKEHLVLLRATDGMLALQTLYYPEDVRVRDKKEILERLEGVDVSAEELAMAEQLVAGLAKPFAPEEYPNETRAALVEFLEAKAAGPGDRGPRGEPGAGAGDRPDGRPQGEPGRGLLAGGRGAREEAGPQEEGRVGVGALSGREARDRVAQDQGPDHDQQDAHDHRAVGHQPPADGVEDPARAGAEETWSTTGASTPRLATSTNTPQRDRLLTRGQTRLRDDRGGGDHSSRFLGLAADSASPAASARGQRKPSMARIHPGTAASSRRGAGRAAGGRPGRRARSRWPARAR